MGANGAYRLVVSSDTGRRFVVDRLERRLGARDSLAGEGDARRIADQVYDRAGLLVPGIVLRSTGLGRTAAEMVGLILARERVEEVEPAVVGPHGFRSWVSLDEHADWSGGVSRSRADLARLRGRLEDDVLHLHVDVVEAKLRVEPDVGRADTQLDRSIRLFEDALGHDERGRQTHVDAPSWRRSILQAVEQTSFAVDGRPAATHVMLPDGPRATLGRELREALRTKRIEVEVRGIFVSLASGDEGADTCTPRGHRWLRMTKEEARRSLLGLGEQVPYPLLDGDPPRTSGLAAGDGPSSVARGATPVEENEGSPEADLEAMSVEVAPRFAGDRVRLRGVR